MDEMERLRDELRLAKEQICQLRERLTLSEEERTILTGQGDGCVRLGDLRPLVRRVFGDAA